MVVGLVQGTLGGITFWIVGMPSVVLFAVLMAIFALLPAIGPAIVWLPVAVYLLATGAIWQGLVVIGSGVFVIGLADNLLRPMLVGRDTGIPDWIVLVTTLGGIATIGLSGIVLGPLLAGLFLAGWRILREDRGGVPAGEVGGWVEGSYVAHATSSRFCSVRYVRELLRQFDLLEVQFHRSCAAEDGDADLDLGLVEIQFLDHAVESREGTVEHLDLVADLVIDADLLLGRGLRFLDPAEIARGLAFADRLRPCCPIPGSR